MGSRIDDRQSVNRGGTKVSWYSLCIIWGRSGESGSNVGGGKIWVVGWVCGKRFCGFIL